MQIEPDVKKAGANAVVMGYDAKSASEFCRRWLPAWTGNRPHHLGSFYTEDAFYADPAHPIGIVGKKDLLAYFSRLLTRYPRWTWTHQRSLPLPDGFLNYWSASLDGDDSGCFEGVCVVRLRDGLIFRNEVFFDRTALVDSTRRT